LAADEVCCVAYFVEIHALGVLHPAVIFHVDWGVIFEEIYLAFMGE
jgi:hypothetical protein